MCHGWNWFISYFTDRHFFISYDPTLEGYSFTYYDYGAKTVRQNWFTIISAFNIVVSITGFFLFKDKS